MTPWRPSRARPHRSWPAAVACLAGIAAACGGAPDPAAVRVELEAVTRRWEEALRAGRPDEVAPEVFTLDAVRLPPGEPPVRGLTAIEAALRGSAPLAEVRFRISEVEVSRDLAHAMGTYVVRTPSGERLAGKFLEVWKRTGEGWRIHRVMWD